MDNYYHSDTDLAERKGSKTPFALRLLDLVVLLLSALALVMLLLTLVTSHYDPSLSWVFAMTGLVTPAIYLFALFMALYWVIRWRWIYATLLLIPLAIGAPAVSRYIKIETSKSYGELPRRGVLRLMSYNVKHLSTPEWENSTADVSRFVEEAKPDIVCFQEFSPSRMTKQEEPDLFRNYSCTVVDDMATYSRYKILRSSENLVGDEFESGVAFWSDILVGRDTLRLYNIHLHSTAITANDDEYLSGMKFLSDSLSDDILKGMISRFRTTSIGRAAQADTIASSIAESPYRVIVCGDFNDTPNSYAYRKISKGLNDAFQQAGVGYSYTYCGFFNLLRIDYVMVEEPLKVLSYEVVDSVRLSDHLPIVTTLKL